MKIFLIGYRCTGKTTIGKILSNRLNYIFFDMDQVIEQHTGSSITNLVNVRGWNYFRQIELQNENRDYWKGKYEGLREGFGFENQKAPAPPTFPTEKDWSEEIFWLLFVLGVIGLVMYLSNRNTPPSPAAPAAAPVIVYPPAPAPPAPTLPVPPTSSELMKLMKENGGKFTVGSDGSWAADVYEQKKEKSATEAAAIDVKEEK
jgi:hypothetical protein